MNPRAIFTLARRLRPRAAIIAAVLALSILPIGCGEQSDQRNGLDKDNGLSETVAGWLGLGEDHTAIDKIRALADQKCHEGNQPACDTIVQQVDSRVAIESVADVPTLTPACDAGNQESCQQLAVLHAELSQWCNENNSRACATVNVGPWPRKWDIPALVDSAKLACLNGKLAPESPTCRSLKNF